MPPMQKQHPTTAEYFDVEFSFCYDDRVINGYSIHKMKILTDISMKNG